LVFGEQNPFFGKTHSEITKSHLSNIKGTKINIDKMDPNGKFYLIGSFSSVNKAAEYIGISRSTILKYAKSEKLYKNIYKFSLL